MKSSLLAEQESKKLWLGLSCAVGNEREWGVQAHTAQAAGDGCVWVSRGNLHEKAALVILKQES